MLRVAASAIVTNVIYFISERYLTKVKAIYRAMKHFVFWTFRARASPQLSEVAIWICLVANAHETVGIKSGELKRPRTWVSESQPN